VSVYHLSFLAAYSCCKCLTYWWEHRGKQTNTNIYDSLSRNGFNDCLLCVICTYPHGVSGHISFTDLKNLTILLLILSANPRQSALYFIVHLLSHIKICHFIKWTICLLYCHLVRCTVWKVPCLNVAGAGSTPLHYAACGGNVVCCQVCSASPNFVQMFD